MVSRRSFLAGSAGAVASVRLAGPAWATPKLNDDGLYHEPWFLESLLELVGRPRRRRRAGQAVRHHVGAARLPVLPRHACDQFRQAGDRRVREGAVRHSPAQHHRRARGCRFRRREAAGKAAGGEIRRPVHADFPVFCGALGRARGPQARARSCGRRAIWCRRTSSRCSGWCPSAPTNASACPTTCGPARVRSGTWRATRPSDTRSPWSAARRPSRRRTARTSGTRPCASSPDRS